jgi:hypothetical protein
MAVLSETVPGRTHYLASNVGHDIYGFIGYELPLKKWIGGVRITPYFMYEYSKIQDTLNYLNGKRIRPGLNVKVNPFVTFKAEYLKILDSASQDLQKLILQMAVAF